MSLAAATSSTASLTNSTALRGFEPTPLGMPKPLNMSHLEPAVESPKSPKAPKLAKLPAQPKSPKVQIPMIHKMTLPKKPKPGARTQLPPLMKEHVPPTKPMETVLNLMGTQTIWVNATPLNLRPEEPAGFDDLGQPSKQRQALKSSIFKFLRENTKSARLDTKHDKLKMTVYVPKPTPGSGISKLKSKDHE